MVEQVGSLRKREVGTAILSRNQKIDKCLLASEKDFEDQSSYTSGVIGTLASLYVEPAEGIFSKFTEFVQLALDGFCFPARVCGMRGGCVPCVWPAHCQWGQWPEEQGDGD